MDLSDSEDVSSKASEESNFREFQEISSRYFQSKLTISQCRRLSSDTLGKQIEDCIDASTADDVMPLLIPLVLYFLNCSLSLDYLLQNIDSMFSFKSSNELFQLFFQNSEPHLKAILVHNFSFSNPVPFYYPLIREYSEKESIEFTLCRELWYSLTPHNAVISFGIGEAANQPVGKSTLLDLIFKLKFVQNNNCDSCFHRSAIDLRLTKNFFAGIECDPYYTDWAFFDFHGPTNERMVEVLLTQIDIVIIHVLQSDVITDFDNIQKQLQSLNLKDKKVFLFIRDASKDTHVSRSLDVIYYQHEVQNLSNRKVDKKTLSKLKKIGEIILQSANIQKFTSNNLEEILKNYDAAHFLDFQERTFISKIINPIIESRQNQSVSYGFLNYYPTFIDLVKKKYQILGENDQNRLEILNQECSQCFDKLNQEKNTLAVNTTFQDIISRPDAMLILWKLAQELQILTNEAKDKSVIREQSNDKYSIEILWREAILNHKYFFQDDLRKNEYTERLSKSLSAIVKTGEPFELIDGDNLIFFSKELNSMLRYFYEGQTEYVQQFNAKNPDNKITEVPLVVSIIGPQSSGKSTLLNYVFGCKFITNIGRCTRGVYASILELDKPINKSKFLMVLDTEGIDAAERKHITTSSSIHFDRSLVLFCLSVSNIVIINLKGELNNEMHELIRICAHSLNHLKIHKTIMPKIVFVLNQNADLSLEERDVSLRLLTENLDEGFSGQKEHMQKISELIQLTKDDIFTLSTAYSTERVDLPGEEIFKKRVDIRTSCIHFALDCSSLRESIFERLKHNINDSKRLSVTSMSEWFEMTGDTWSTIIKFQDIVKYKNFEELRTCDKLKEVIVQLMNEHFYLKKQEIQGIVDQYSNEITSFDVNNTSAEQLDDKILQNTKKFEDEFRLRKERCIIEFKSRGNDVRLDSLPFKENLEHLEKLIAKEKLDYIICLKLRSNEVYNQRKRKEHLVEFKKAVTSDLTNYLTMTLIEQDEKFEKLWKSKFNEDNFERLYRRQNLVDFYLMFSFYWDLIPLTQLVEIYQNADYNLDKLDEILLESLKEHLTNTSQDKEPFFYPTKKSSFLKDIQPCYSYTKKLEYLNEDELYYVHSTEGQESKFLKYFPNCKTIYKHDWVPEDCVPLLQSCSGYYSEHDIDWKRLSPNKQIVKLVTSFLNLPSLQPSPSKQILSRFNRNSSELDIESKKDSFVQQIIEEIELLLHERKFRETEPIIFHATIQGITDALEKRLSIFNHEISYIGAELTIHARRSFGTYVFSKVFNVHFNRMWGLDFKNRAEISKEKKAIKIYFMKRVETIRIIHSNEECVNSSSYDINIAEKYASTYIKSLQEKISHHLFVNGEQLLHIDKQMFSYQSLFQEAVQTLSNYLNGEETSSDHSHFVVRYYCDRNSILKEIFDRKWEEQVSGKIPKLVNNVVEDYHKEVLDDIAQLRDLMTLFNVRDVHQLNSKQCFKPCDILSSEWDCSILNERPYKAMTMYLHYLLDPKITVTDMEEYLLCNNLRMKPPLDLLKKKEDLRRCKINKLLMNLVQEDFFNSELIFNLHTFLSHFIECLEKFESTNVVIQNSYIFRYIKSNYIRSSLGCTKGCPCCGISCDQQMRHTSLKCSSSSGHQFASMGGKTWENDKQHSAILMRCEEYTNDTIMVLPDRLIKWIEFKQYTESNWDWNINSNISQEETRKRMYTMVQVWNRFGNGILKYHADFNSSTIAFRSYEETKATSESSLILKFQICFVIDGTGSMGKDIENVILSIQRLAELYKKTNKQVEFRIVIYRDHCDIDIIETYPNDKVFIETIHEINQFLANIQTHGGGDDPEASLDGLVEGLRSNWDRGKETRRLIIHLYDAPPHGSFPNYKVHNTNSNPDHCCCCSGKCEYDWERDVWRKMRTSEVEYHGINTDERRWTEFENTMKRQLDYLCKGFTNCGKEQVNDAVMQIFINYSFEA